MLDLALAKQLRTHLEKITDSIRLVAVLDDGRKSIELHELLEEIAVMSPQISYERPEPSSPSGGARVPSFRIERVAAASDVAVTFAGIPLGHEFTSLVLGLLQVGGYPPKFDDTTVEQIKALDGEFVFETFFSLSCQNCPDVVQALNAMSVLNPRIQHTAIDGALFQDEVDRREVMSVPTMFLNGEKFDQGRMTVEQIVAKLDAGVSERAVVEINAKDPVDTLIVGGGPAGAAAAIYLARKGVNTAMVVERFGGQVVDTMGIENLISVPYTEGPKLAAALEQNVKEHDVDVMSLQRANKIEADATTGLKTVQLESGASLQAKTVILSTGARWRKLNVSGEEQYANKGVAYCPHCDGPLFKGKRVAVVGGGNSGVEAAIDLAQIASHVTVIEFSDKLLADDVLQANLQSLSNVTTILNAATTEVLGDGAKVTGLTYDDRGDGTSHTLELEGIFVQIGLLPNTDWLAGSVKLSERSEIVINDRGETSMSGVFAAGDCTTVPYKQIVIALGAGSTAALSAFDYLIRT